MPKKLLKAIYRNAIPTGIANRIRTRFELKQLGNVSTEQFDFGPLQTVSTEDLTQIFNDDELENDFRSDQEILAKLDLPESTGGVNVGDQKAIYFLIRHFKPTNVLEVGTFIGCSTVHIAMAVRHTDGARLTTVDINDVNDLNEKRWEKYGAKNSPIENVRSINCQDIVSFQARDSREYLSGYQGEKYDFVFLDGNHEAAYVYYEVAQTLKILRPGGLILLHDFCPGGVPLWEGAKRTIPGPYVAVERILRENPGSVTVLPLGELPWQTKLNSRVTSLALVSKPDVS